MSTISVTLPADGQTIDAADVNAPINTIVTEINGNLNSQNIADSGITPNELMSGTGSTWAWTTFTPSWTNVTVGNGTNSGKYLQIGKTVFVRVDLTFGSTTAMGTGPSLTLPVTSSTSAYTTVVTNLGNAVLNDTGTATYWGPVRWISATSVDFTVWNSASTYLVVNGVTNTIPHTWTTSDSIHLEFYYEAA